MYKINCIEDLGEYDDTDGGFQRTVEGLYDDEDSSTIQIVFDVINDRGFERYYCLVKDVRNLNEALGVFFKNHPHVTYNMIVDHMEV